MKKLFCFVLSIASASTLLAQEIPTVYTKLNDSYNNSDFETCITMTGEIESFVKDRVDTLASNSLYFLAEAYNQTGNLNKALEFYEREKDLTAKMQVELPEWYSNSLYNLSYWYVQAGQFNKAVVYAEQVLANDRKLYEKDAIEYVNSVINIAHIYIELNRYKDAEHLLNATLRAQEKSSFNEGILLNKLGDLYWSSEQLSKAQRTLEKAADILFDVAGENSGEYVTTAISLGLVYMDLGKFPEAEELFEVALNNTDESTVAFNSVLNNQGLVYQSLGQLERSEQIFKRIQKLDSASIGTDHPDYAITLANLGQVLADEGKYAEAESALKTALEIQKKNNESKTVSYGRKLHNLAKIYYLSGQPQKAIPAIEEALAIFKKNLTENSPQYASAMYSLGNAYWKAGKGSVAIKHLKTSASIRAKVLGKKHPKYAESVQKIGEYQWLQKQTSEASQSFGEVFENYYYQLDVTFPGLTEEEKSRFYYTNIKDAFEKFNSFAVANGKENPELLGALYNYHINTKGAIMVATEKVRKAILGSGDSTLIGMFDTWHEQKEQIARYYSQSVDNKKLDSLVNAANIVEKELTRRSADFATQFSKKRYTWQDIQKTLKPGEAAIEVVRFKQYTPENAGSFTDNVLYAFLILTSQTTTAPQLVVIEKGNDLEAKFLKYYHNNIQYQLDDLRSYQNYVLPLAEVLRKNDISRFYLSPDGVYNQVNINTIQNPETGKYLLDEYDINLVTNTKDLLEPQITKVAQQNSIMIGFPKFNLEKTTDSSGEKVKATRSRGLTRGMRGLLRLMRGDEGITELPGTQKEIQQISTLFNTPPQIYLEHQATEDIAKQVNNPAYLHIATHGYFLADDDNSAKTENQYVANPLLKAGLILAGAENFIRTGEPINDAGDDGILTAYEAMNLRLDDTKLVVLSACETGLGEVKNGEGVYGLQRALRLAGTKSIVMSLWSVDDDATQELMSTFYAQLMQTGDQHASFRIAQQKIKDKYKNPFYWGAFIMVGI